MKKYIIPCVLSLFLVACGDTESNKPIDDLVEANTSESNEGTPEVGDYIEIPEEFLKEPKDFSALEAIEVDQDISILPQSLAFAQVQRMMFYPKEYEGDSVKMVGLYYYEQIPALNIGIRAIMMMDETSCCQGYFELEFPEGTVYPNIGDEIMVIGNYEARNDGEYDYGVLVVTEYIL